MLRVVLERAVGDLTLPASVRIVAAANPPEQAADGWDLPAPLANRLIHLDWTVSSASVADGFTGGFSTPSLEGYGVCADVDRTRALVGAFLRVRPEPVLNVPDGPARAWPSPRTWEPAAIALAHTIKAPDEVRAELVTGAVGEAAGYELLSWLRDLNLPDPETLLAGPGTPRCPPAWTECTPCSARSSHTSPPAGTSPASARTASHGRSRLATRLTAERAGVLRALSSFTTDPL
ncbi:hypothetical protein GCM10027203_04590 [Nonomuraea fastidiosa]